MAKSAASELVADILIRAKKIYTNQPSIPIQRALAIRGHLILDVSSDSNGLDKLIGPNTKIIDEGEGIVLPTFDDTHTHLIFAGLGQFDVPVHTAKNLAQLLALIRERALKTEPGKWISTTTNWQEFNLPEKRFPTAQELDEISTEHPIIVKRGGHNIVANSYALRLSGITATTEPPLGGRLGRNSRGELNGLVQDSATTLIYRVQPPVSLEERIAGLDSATASYAATGIGCVRDCFVPIGDVPILKATHDAGKLHIRVRALVSGLAVGSVSDMETLLDEMEQWRYLQNDPWLAVWGVKFMIDGGIEAGATEEPYLSEGCGCVPHATEFRGRLLWQPEKLVEVMDAVLRRGWKIGTHAYGDRASRILLDVYEQLLKRHPNLPKGSLVMEHGALATAEQRKRAITLGIPVTVQLPFLHDVAGIQEVYWGQERVSRTFPLRQWIDAGGHISAGSDFPVGPYGAIVSLWSMATRETVVGVRGPEHVISIPEGIALHTTAATELLGESESRGILGPGRFADLNIWKMDPHDGYNGSEVPQDKTLYSIVGGQIKHAAN